MSRTLPDHAFAAGSSQGDWQSGLTVRQYYAARALEGLLSNPSWNTIALAAAGVRESEAFDVAAKMAVLYADALIAAENG